jgi:hypothetical protein
MNAILRLRLGKRQTWESFDPQITDEWQAHPVVTSIADIRAVVWIAAAQ